MERFMKCSQMLTDLPINQWRHYVGVAGADYIRCEPQLGGMWHHTIKASIKASDLHPLRAHLPHALTNNIFAVHCENTKWLCPERDNTIKCENNLAWAGGGKEQVMIHQGSKGVGDDSESKYFDLTLWFTYRIKNNVNIEIYQTF